MFFSIKFPENLQPHCCNLVAAVEEGQKVAVTSCPTSSCAHLRQST